MKHAIVILGMHRSGTSALARGISFFGFGTPHDSIPPLPDNPKGFWEPRSVVHLNNEILSTLGAAWDKPEYWLSHESSFTTARRTAMAQVAHRWQREASAVVRASFGAASSIVLKDPRITLLAPFWKNVLTGEGYEAHFVLMYRNPLEVAASLKLRNGISPLRGFQLWQHYAMNALLPDAAIGLDGVVSFEDFLERPEAPLVASVLAKFGTHHASNEKALRELRDFVAQTDRHHLFTVADVMASPDVPDLVKRTWQLLQAWQEMAPEARVQEVQAVYDTYEDAVKLFGMHAPNPPKKTSWQFWG